MGVPAYRVGGGVVNLSWRVRHGAPGPWEGGSALGSEDGAGVFSEATQSARRNGSYARGVP